MDHYRLAKASFAGICPSPSLKGKVLAPGGRSGQIFEIFELLGGVGDIHTSISMTHYCDEPYIQLGLYANKVLSAWTEVWNE